MARSASLHHCLGLLLVVTVATVNSQPNAHAKILDQDALQNVRFICNFEHNACHFRNQFNLARFTRLKRPEGFLGERAVLLLDLNRRAVKKYPGARIITHYFQTKYRNACLFLTYHMSGYGPEAFYVIQQDTENRCVYADEYEDKPRNAVGWKTVQLQLDLSEGSPRFFLQAEYNPNYDGYIAIANFTYAYGNCRYNNANHCFSGYQPDNDDQSNNNNNDNDNHVVPPKQPSNKPMPDPF